MLLSMISMCTAPLLGMCRNLVQGWLSSIQDFLARVVDGMGNCAVDASRVQRICSQVPFLETTCMLWPEAACSA